MPAGNEYINGERGRNLQFTPPEFQSVVGSSPAPFSRLQLGTFGWITSACSIALVAGSEAFGRGSCTIPGLSYFSIPTQAIVTGTYHFAMRFNVRVGGIGVDPIRHDVVVCLNKSAT